MYFIDIYQTIFCGHTPNSYLSIKVFIVVTKSIRFFPFTCVIETNRSRTKEQQNNQSRIPKSLLACDFGLGKNNSWKEKRNIFIIDVG